MSEHTITDLVRCAERELRLRKSCYQRWVEGGTMQADTAQEEIAMMEAIVANLKAQAPPDPQGKLL